jgi:hypothetical protein
MKIPWRMFCDALRNDLGGLIELGHFGVLGYAWQAFIMC